MKYIYQFSLIMLFVILGEICSYLIPLPIAGAIYGLVLLFLALVFKVVKLSWVEDTANYLHSIMALFFIALAVAIIQVWPKIAHAWLPVLLLLVVAYLITMVTTGLTADALITSPRRDTTRRPLERGNLGRNQVKREKK